MEICKVVNEGLEVVLDVIDVNVSDDGDVS